MPVDPTKFKPSVTPETWMEPTNGCRQSTLLTAARYQSLDEAFTNPSGSRWSDRQRTKQMKELRAASSVHRGESPQEADGYSRDDAIFAYRTIYPGWRVLSVGLRPAQMRQYLRDGYFLSLSGNVNRTHAGCILRRRVNGVPHEIGLARLNADGTKVLVYEPMREDKPIWVPWSCVKAFGTAFTYDNGRRVCIAFPIAWATDAAAAERASERRATRLKGERDDWQAKSNAFEDMLDSANQEIAGLEAQLEQCEDSGEDGYEQALDDVNDAIEDLRERGYEPI